jgi:hypothetical protein
VHILITILGYGTAIFSACFILIFTSILFDEEEENTNGTIAAMAIFTGTLAVGAYMVRVSHRQRDEKREKQILQLAADKSGRVTAEEVAMLSNLNVETSRKILDDLCLQGAAQLQVTAEGVMEYVFYGLTTPELSTKPDTP